MTGHSWQQVTWFLKEFPLETPYTAVTGSVRRLNEAYGFAAGYLDQTGVGERPFEEIKQFIRVMEGITLTAPVKENILGRLRPACFSYLRKRTKQAGVIELLETLMQRSHTHEQITNSEGRQAFYDGVNSSVYVP